MVSPRDPILARFQTNKVKPFGRELGNPHTEIDNVASGETRSRSCASKSAFAAILMCAGVGLFGTFSGFLAAWFIAPNEEAVTSEIDVVRSEIAELRDLLLARSVIAKSPGE
jgi:hypothetical protein